MSSGNALKFASKQLRSDIGIVSAAIEQDVKSVSFMEPSLWKNRKILGLILAKDGLYLEKVDSSLKGDFDLVLRAVIQDSRASIHMDDELWANEEIVTKIIESNGLSLEKASNKLKNNYDICMIAVKQNGLALEFVPIQLRSNVKIVQTALNSDGRALRFCTLKQRKDSQLITLAIKNNIDSIRYAEIPKSWMNRKDKSTYVGYIHEHGIGVAKNISKAKTLYTRSAEAGDVTAMVRLAYIYLNGLGNNRDYDKSYRWFNLAAESGSIDGLVMLGYMKQKALSVNKDTDGAEELYLKGLASSLNIDVSVINPNIYRGGHAKAAYLLAKLYASKRPKSNSNSKIALGFFLVAAEQGYLKAQISLANLYLTGEHGSRSFINSLRWNLKAARQGSLNSLFASGLHYDLGLGLKNNKAKANEYYEEARIKGYPGLSCLINESTVSETEPPEGMSIDGYIKYLAERGDSRFQCLLGSFFNKGWNRFTKDQHEAFEWMKKSAKQGHPEAQVYLARSLYTRNDNSKQLDLANRWLNKALSQKYSKSFTLKADTYLFNQYSKDYDNAIKWLSKAADLNDREAQRKLGMLYNRGIGVSKDQAVAFEWLEKASLNGDDIAMVNMAIMYEFGNGISKNEQKAILWYKKAASLGNKQAAENLRILEDQGVAIHKVHLD